MTANITIAERRRAIRALREHLWRALQTDLEVSWLADPTAERALELLERTVVRLRERRQHEESWRGFLALRDSASC